MTSLVWYAMKYVWQRVELALQTIKKVWCHANIVYMWFAHGRNDRMNKYVAVTTNDSTNEVGKVNAWFLEFRINSALPQWVVWYIIKHADCLVCFCFMNNVCCVMRSVFALLDSVVVWWIVFFVGLCDLLTRIYPGNFIDTRVFMGLLCENGVRDKGNMSLRQTLQNTKSVNRANCYNYRHFMEVIHRLLVDSLHKGPLVLYCGCTVCITNTAPLQYSRWYLWNDVWTIDVNEFLGSTYTKLSHMGSTTNNG